MDNETQSAPEKATRFNFWLYSDLRQQLEELSQETGAPIGEILRRAAAAWIRQQEQQRRLA